MLGASVSCSLATSRPSQGREHGLLGAVQLPGCRVGLRCSGKVTDARSTLQLQTPEGRVPGSAWQSCFVPPSEADAALERGPQQAEAVVQLQTCQVAGLLAPGLPPAMCLS